MNRDKIKDRIRKKEAEIQTLEEKVRAARSYIHALNDVLKMLSDGEDGPTEHVLRAGSSVDQARDVILKAGRPVHLNDLLRALGREPTREARSSLTGSLAAYVRRDEIFARTAPNTYGLLELGHTAGTEIGPDEPPPGFGRVSIQTPDDDDEIQF